MLPTQSELRSMLEYDPLTGIVTWKENRSNMIKGSVAGCVHSSGYRVIGLNNKTQRLQRVIWVYMFGHIPEGFYIDHINGNKLDNRLENLRLATNNQNQQNRPAPKNSSSGYRGVTWHKQVNKWMSRICHNGERTTIGFFDSAEEAYTAYKKEANKLFTHHNRLP